MWINNNSNNKPNQKQREPIKSTQTTSEVCWSSKLNNNNTLGNFSSPRDLRLLPSCVCRTHPPPTLLPPPSSHPHSVSLGAVGNRVRGTRGDAESPLRCFCLFSTTPLPPPLTPSTSPSPPSFWERRPSVVEPHTAWQVSREEEENRTIQNTHNTPATQQPTHTPNERARGQQNRRGLTLPHTHAHTHTHNPTLQYEPWCSATCDCAEAEST